MRALMTFIAALLFAAAAHAADLTVRVTTRDGAPVADAVVLFRPTQAARGPIRFPWPYRVAQHNIAFEPHVLIVPVGAEVQFPNLDTVRHHVYSFSTGNQFELRLYGHDETRSVHFNTVGIAAVGCNIHDRMSAYVVVVDTPFAGKTDATGQVVLSGVTGAGELSVWHPQLRAPGNRLAQQSAFAAEGAAQQAFTIDLRPAAPAMHH